MVRLSKTIMVMAIALFATLVSFGNITDYHTNFEFVRHVLLMDSVFSGSTITYRSLHAPWIHHCAYIVIIILETLTAIACWIGAIKMGSALKRETRAFQAAKRWAIAGLTLGFLTWQVGFMSIGGEWFGMWMSKQWNGVTNAFQFSITLLAILIYITLNNDDINNPCLP